MYWPSSHSEVFWALILHGTYTLLGVPPEADLGWTAPVAIALTQVLALLVIGNAAAHLAARIKQERADETVAVARHSGLGARLLLLHGLVLVLGWLLLWWGAMPLTLDERSSLRMIDWPPILKPALLLGVAAGVSVGILARFRVWWLA